MHFGYGWDCELNTSQPRLTTRCSGAREAQFVWLLVRPFARPLNALLDSASALLHKCSYGWARSGNLVL